MHVDRRYECLDGNEAAARVAFAVSEVIPIYPITPVSPWRSTATTGRLPSDRTVATHALSIFGDHSDVMQARTTAAEAQSRRNGHTAGAKRVVPPSESGGAH